ncbi:MAG TPA: hypothetical protein VLC28_02765 [Flavitalea sp.]|nr:hypothetical protein [Flavitalea sp.]
MNLLKLGLEYAHEFGHLWELKSGIIYDIKWQAYNSISISVGVGRAFGLQKK